MRDYFYGEWVLLENESEISEAEQYLKMWKKFFIRKLPKDLQFMNEQMVIRDKQMCDHFHNPQTVGMKLHFKGPIRELGKEIPCDYLT